MKNNINYDQPDLAIFEADSQNYGNLYHDVPEQVKYENPINYSNETNTVVKENVKNINDFLVNYGISIEDKDKCIREGVSFTQKDILKHDLVVIVKNGLRFDLNDLKEIISGIVDNTTLTKVEIESIIIAEVSKSIPPDTGDVVARLVSLENKAIALKDSIDTLTSHSTVIDGVLLSINSRISDIVNTQSEQYAIISSIDSRLFNAEHTITSTSNEVSSIISQISSIKLDIVSNSDSITNILATISSITNRINTLEVLINSANTNISTILDRLSTIDISILSLSTDILTISHRLSNNETLANTNSNKITTINGAIATINTSISEINTALASRYSEIQSILHSINDINATISQILNDTSLETRVSNLEAEVSTGMSEILAIEDTISKEKVKTSANIADINTINSEISTIIVSLDTLGHRIDSLDPNTGDIATRLTAIEANYTNILHDINDVKADIITIQNEELGEDAILTNNVKILNYKYYQMIESGEIVYVIKKHANNMCIIKRVDDNGGYFDIRYSAIFDIGELPKKMSNLEAVGYNDLSLINM